MIFLLLMLILPLTGQTTTKMFHKVYQYDQNGISAQSAAQVFDDRYTSTFSYGYENQLRYGDTFYTAYAVQLNHTKYYTILRTSTDGETWSDGVQASDSIADNYSGYPSMAIWGDPAQPNICVIYLEYAAAGLQLRAAISTDGGQSFAPSVRLDDYTNAAYIVADLAVDDAGNLYVTWNYSAGSTWDTTWFTRSSDGGQNWSPKSLIHTGRAYSYPSQIIARNSGEVLIAICDDQYFKANLVVYRSSDSGDTWQAGAPATNYITNQGFRYFTLIKDQANNAHFAQYFYENSNLLEFRHQSSSDWGSSWSDFHAMSDTSTSPLQFGISGRNHPYLVASAQGNLYAAWSDARHDPSGNEFEAYLTRSVDGGLTWEPEIRINDDTALQLHTYPTLAVATNGNLETVSVIWTETFPLVGIGDPAPTTVQNFQLGQNYPNPFNPSTTIPFTLAEAATVQLEVYNVMGQRVTGSAVGSQRAVNLQPGHHTLVWDGRSDAGLPLTTGVYFYRLLVNGVPSQTRKMLFLK